MKPTEDIADKVLKIVLGLLIIQLLILGGMRNPEFRGRMQVILFGKRIYETR